MTEIKDKKKPISYTIQIGNQAILCSEEEIRNAHRQTSKILCNIGLKKRYAENK